MDLGLRDKVAVITGASIGIGLAVAEGLAAEGAHIVMAARQGDRLTKEAKRIAKKHGVKTLAVACDVATAKGAAKLVAATKKQFKGRRHPHQQRRHRLQRNHHGGGRRQVAVLLGSSRHGRRAPRSRTGANDEESVAAASS